MPGTDEGRIHGLYVIIDPAACAGRSPVDVAKQAIRGGASVVQWRDKTRDKGDQLADAQALAALCRANGVAFIINDHADLASACNADGVHLGQHDLPVQAVRPLLGRPAIVGVSANNAAEAVRAQEAGADYVAVGSMFATSTKLNTRPASLDRLREVKAAVRIPVVAIGGITAANIDGVVEAGADAVAVISAVCGAPDPVSAARALAKVLGHPPPPQSRRSITPKRRSTLRAMTEALVDALRTRDKAAFLGLFAEDGIIQEDPPLPSGVGREALGAWWDRLMQAQPAYSIEVDNVFVPADDVALVWSIKHGHQGEERVAHGVEIIGFEGQRIASIHSYWQRNALSPAAQRIVDAYVSTLNEGDRDGFVDLFADEAVQQDPVGTPPRIGRRAIAAWLDDAFASYPPFDLAGGRVFASGDEIALEWTTTHHLDGKSRSFSGVDIIALEGEKIGSVHSYYEADNLPPFT